MDAKVTQVLAELRRRFEELYGPRLVRMILYGSQARGDAEPDSDIDVLVILRGPVQPGVEIGRAAPIYAALSLEQDVVISCMFASEDRFTVADYAEGSSLTEMDATEQIGRAERFLHLAERLIGPIAPSEPEQK